MTAFHKTTVTILTYVLGEQQRDLSLAQLRLDRGNASTLKTDIERERFAKATDTIRDQITELTAVVGDFERLIAFVNDENTEAAELQAAREQVAEAAATATAPHRSGQPCPGCPDCIGYPDLSEPQDDKDEALAAEQAELVAIFDTAIALGRALDAAEQAEDACGRCAEPGHQAGDCEAILDDSVVPIMIGDDYDDEEPDRAAETEFTLGQLDGSACAHCNVMFSQFDAPVPFDSVQVGANLRLHKRCAAESEA